MKESGHPSPETTSEIMSLSKAIAQTVTNMAKMSKKLKGKDFVDSQEQMAMIAENEMMKAAESIERAAQRLAELRHKREVIDETSQVNIVR